ncbi:MAG: site-specific integrase, partial [Oscillospiraceae bacterium]|nr:site-specific integrase [Oscillospiraceae bacterium]
AKKRANGEGNIRKRKDGRWEGRYTAGRDPVTGKPIYKNVLAKTQKECKEKLARAIEKNGKIDVTKSGQYTVEEWCWSWHENYCKPAVKDSTAEYYRSYIEHHIAPNIGKIKLEKLTTLDLQKFYNKEKKGGRVEKYAGMEDRSLSARTVRGLHAMLRTALDQAVKERLIPYNPAIGCRLPPKEKKEMQILPPEKIGAYLSAAEEHGVLPMFYLELTTGLRRGELTALLWTDLDVESRTLTVSKSAGRLKGEVRVTQPKTANSIRTIILPKETVDLLVQEHAKHPDNPVMFPSPVTGKMYGPDCVGRLHKTLMRKAGLTENVTLHGLRHTYATLAIQNGVDVKTVSKILGHYSAGFTLDTYTHVTGEMQKEAADRMGGFMAQTR